MIAANADIIVHCSFNWKCRPRHAVHFYKYNYLRYLCSCVILVHTQSQTKRKEKERKKMQLPTQLEMPETDLAGGGVCWTFSYHRQGTDATLLDELPAHNVHHWCPQKNLNLPWVRTVQLCKLSKPTPQKSAGSRHPIQSQLPSITECKVKYNATSVEVRRLAPRNAWPSQELTLKTITGPNMRRR